ncbi:deoxynucleotidyltransferase terminal-interacting protein 2 [Culicoides brevitarsis]|uniref:deoxynucleotidyltransferase terminal-interacting protein 2 n=1 Tax=Culicoides brevitarsis TaxID=469753 RepID=UPI00307B4C80
MDLFVIDTCPDKDLYQESSEDEEEIASEPEKVESEDDDEDYGGLPPPSKDITHIIKNTKQLNRETASVDVSQLIRKKNDTKNKKKKGLLPFKAPIVDSGLQEIIQNEIKSAVKTNTNAVVAGKKSLDTVSMSERKLLKLRRAEASKTKGNGWFNLPAPEITEEVKNELELIRMRGALDSKHFYKRAESKVLPKYFQIGKVLPSPLDHYNERHEGKKSKAKTLVDELLADAEFQKKNKRKYKEIIDSKRSVGFYKAAAKMKKEKRKKK